MVPHDQDWPDRNSTVVTRAKEGELLVQTIERALASHTEVQPTEFSPLYDYVETDALATLINHAMERGSEITVQFTIKDYRVVICQDGCVTVHDVS